MRCMCLMPCKSMRSFICVAAAETLGKNTWQKAPFVLRFKQVRHASWKFVSLVGCKKHCEHNEWPASEWLSRCRYVPGVIVGFLQHPVLTVAGRDEFWSSVHPWNTKFETAEGASEKNTAPFRPRPLGREAKATSQTHSPTSPNKTMS